MARAWYLSIHAALAGEDGLASDILNFLYLCLAWMTTLMQRIQLRGSHKEAMHKTMEEGEWSQDKRK